MAAHGAAAYVLGWNARDELVVWRTEDGETWQTIPCAAIDHTTMNGNADTTVVFTGSEAW